MNNKQVIYNLIDKASLLKRNRHHLLNKSGENFNIFSVLHLEYDEAKLHSRFIAGLLNPQGLHGQKALFLQKFLDQVNLPSVDTSQIAQAKVYAEEYIGPISKECTSGGFIDIVIKIPHDQVIVIENKINAADQKHQLIRYKNAYPDAYLLYLTKFGNLPSNFSTHDQASKQVIVDFEKNPKHARISYEKHILPWLEDCYLEMTRFPLMRENLFQYISTIKKITNQLTDNYMSNEIADAILSSNEHLDGFFTLRKTEVIKAVERNLLYKFIDETMAIAEKLGLVYDESNSERELGHKEDDTEIVFTVPGTPFSIAYGFNTWRKDFCIGIGFAGEKNENFNTLLSKRFSNLLGNDACYPNWYYLLYLKHSKHGDEYLSDWLEGDFEIWGSVNEGTIAKRVGWYFETFLSELKELKLIS